MTHVLEKVALHLDSYEVYTSLMKLNKDLYNFVRGVIAPTLLSHQIAHALRLITGLSKHRRMLDVSVMGCGKTYTSLFAVKWLGIQRVVVIAPEVTRDGWNRARKHFGVSKESITFIPYTDFQKKAKPFLELDTTFSLRVNLRDPRAPPPELKYRTTSEFRERCVEPTLIIIDEIHYIKNDTVRTDCVRELISTVLKNDGYVLGLSATPYDKKDHAVRMLMTMGIIEHPVMRVVDAFRRIRDYTGLRELCTFLKIRYHRDWERYDAREIKELVFDMISGPLKKRMYSHMALPKTLNIDTHIQNLFAFADEESLEILMEGAELLRRGLVAFGIQQGQLAEGEDPLAKITRGLKCLERGKINMFERYIRQEISTKKVVVMMNYLDSIHGLAGKLREFNPMVITGSVDKETRKEFITNFQSSNWDRKLLICNVQIMGVGIDLDDKVGTFPRSMLLSPSYRLIDLHQACGRVLRTDTRSIPSIKFLYAEQVSHETRLLGKLAEKSGVVRSTVNYVVKLPGDYPKVVESRF